MKPFRIGHGYDVHPLVPDRDLIIGGVIIPHTQGLMGHSDADVALHAVMDAVLGALGSGDIGSHFPDTDMKYKGINSLLLCEDVFRIMDEQGYEIGNLDVTVLAQKPKLRPYITEMERNTAAAFHTSPSNINYKATTEEHLGFTGREEGIAAHAVVLLYRKEASPCSKESF